MSDIIISRRCMVGPGGYFRFGVGAAEVDGAVIVSIDIFRPEPDPECGLEECPDYLCDFTITYGTTIIYSGFDRGGPYGVGIDAVAALLSAARHASRRLRGRVFHAIDGSGRFGHVIPYLDAIPEEFFEDMLHAGTDPDVTAEERVIFQRADGNRVSGRIELGYPHRGWDVHKPTCRSWLDGLDERWTDHEADTPFQAHQVAMASLANRLRAFVDGGGRVLRPDGGAEVDLAGILGPLWTQP